MNNRSGVTKGLIVGFAAGFLLGSVAVGTAALKKEGWLKQDRSFHLGYIVGFNDVIRMAKNSDPGYLEATFKLPPGAKPINWLAQVNKVFDEEYGDKLNITQIMAGAGERLEKTFGTEPEKRKGLEDLAEVLANRRESIEDGRLRLLTDEQIAVRNLVNERHKKLATCKRKCRKTCYPQCTKANKAEFDEEEARLLRLAEESVTRRNAEIEKEKRAAESSD